MATIEQATTPPATIPVNPDGIPDELKQYDQFVAWTWKYRLDRHGEGRWTKPPVSVRTREMASSTNRDTWTTFDQALAAYAKYDHLDGVGIVLTSEDPYFMIDCDHCRDADSGTLDPWAQDILRRFQHTYHEPSPSGTGLRILGRGSLPVAKHTKAIPNAHPKAQIEFYEKGRYTTLTGHGDPASATIENCQAALDALYLELWPAEPDPHPPESSERKAIARGVRNRADDTDDQRLERVRASMQGAAFSRLFDHGDLSGHGNDASRADMGLADMLAFWFGPSPDRIDRLFRRSALMRPKWGERHYSDGRTYGQGTIDTALAGRTEFYDTSPRLSAPTNGQHMSEPTNGQHGEPPAEGPDQRPVINAGDQNLERVSAQAWTALKDANVPPRLFRFGAVPVRVDPDDDDGTPAAQPLTEDRLSFELARSAIWFKQSDRGEAKSASPPMRVIKDLLATPTYPLPALLNIVQTPIFAPDGSLQTEPGYHEAGRTFYAPPPGLVIPPVSDDPTDKDRDRAKHLIVDDLLGEFPFVDDAERANAISLFLDLYARNLIDGPTPLRLIEAPTPGSGKGLLADAVLRPAVGRRVNVMPAANDDDEWRKRITAQLSQLPAAILIDNLTSALDSGALSSALTATWWSDRRLGATDMIRVPVRCVWLATANNPTMSTELARRTVRIRLDPKVDRPWRRTGFRHEDLRGWVDERRGDIVWAALTLIRGWLADGAPLSKARLGSFERWAAVHGGILDSAGVTGFLGNLEEFYEATDLEGAIWRQFVALWFEKFGTTEVGVSQLFDIALTIDGFDFGKGSERSQKTAFGMSLNRQRDRVIGEYRLLQPRVRQRVKRWQLMPTRPEDNPLATLFDDPDDPKEATP